MTPYMCHASTRLLAYYLPLAIRALRLSSAKYIFIIICSLRRTTMYFALVQYNFFGRFEDVGCGLWALVYNLLNGFDISH